MHHTHLSYYYILKYLPVWAMAITLISSALRSRLLGHFCPAKFFKLCFNQLLFWIVGVQSLLYYVTMQWYPLVIHHLLGWSFPNPLLDHVSMFQLSFGVMGLLATIATIGFQSAVTIGYCVFAIGLGVFKIHRTFTITGSQNPLYWLLYDHLIIPLILLILLMIVYQNKKSTA